MESSADYGESAKKKKKSTSLKFNSKNEKTRAESAFHKHLVAADGERDPEKKFSDYLKRDAKCLKEAVHEFSGGRHIHLEPR